MSFKRGFKRGFKRPDFDRPLAALAALLLFAMMILTVIDVCGRYFFARPVPAAFELTQILMAFLIFAALPSVSARGEHVAIGLIDSILGARLLAWRARLIDVAAALIAAVLAWRMAVLALRLSEYGDRFEFVAIRKAWIAWPIAALLAATAVALLCRHSHPGSAAR